MKRPIVFLTFLILQAAFGGADSVLIDRFGQFVHVDFTQKVRGEAELKTDAANDEAYYRSFPIPGRTFWGGLPGSKEKYGLTATGFFHLEKVPALGGRSVLVDPEGALYFHIGMSCVMPGNEFTKVVGRERIYEWLPGAQGEFKAARQGECASFYIANCIRKFGSFDPAEWQARMIDRCRRWGFNAFGEFTRVYGDNAKRGFALTKCLERYAEQEPFHLVAPKFLDPFDEFNFPLLERNFAGRTKPFLGKPELIGYYTENESFYSTVIPALLAGTEPIPAKRRFAVLMRERYADDITGFNRNWNTGFRSFDELASAKLNPVSGPANADVGAYEEVFFDAYFKLLGSTLKKVDPDHLYLGERMLIGQTYNTAVVKALGRYCDIFSVNYYTDDYIPAEVERFAEISGRPVMLSEWSFGSPEQGLYGCRNLPDEEARGKAYSRYAENAAASPHVIGFQWFCLLDESNTGRGWTDFNGERFNLGFLNVCDRPFKKFIAHAAKSNVLVYDLIEGKAKPAAANTQKEMKVENRLMAVGKVKPGIPVDGMRAKYPGRPGEALTRSITGGGANRADFICGWDEQYFYILLTVPDDTPATNSHNRHICLGDGVELFLGADPAGTGRMQPGDRQLLIRAVPGTDPEFLWCINGGTVKTPRRPVVNCRIAADRKSWSMEVAVPWRELGIVPRVGLKFRFDVAVGLSGARNDERTDKLIWNGLENDYCLRDPWGAVVLED